MSLKAPVFHEGERRAQERDGVFDREERVGAFIRDAMPEQHRHFFAKIPFVALAATDDDARMWCTLLTGQEGFMHAPSANTINIASLPKKGCALEHALKAKSPLGLVGIEYATRRRNRLNVNLRRRSANGLSCDVVQSFGNCPKYIPPRALHHRLPAGESSRVYEGATLHRTHQTMIKRSKTFFIGSGFEGKLDASHRGGAPGFVSVQSPTRFVFADFAGNRFFNTIGNLELDPRVGIAFPDFESGTLLQVSGRARIDWNKDNFSQVPGALRMIEVDVEAVVEVEHALDVRWAKD